MPPGLFRLFGDILCLHYRVDSREMTGNERIERRGRAGRLKSRMLQLMVNALNVKDLRTPHYSRF